MKISLGFLLLTIAILAQFSFTSSDYVVDTFVAEYVDPEDPTYNYDILTCKPSDYYGDQRIEGIPDLRSYRIPVFSSVTNTTTFQDPNLYCAQNFRPAGGYCLGGVRRIVVATVTENSIVEPATSSSITVGGGVLYQAVGSDLAAATYISYFGDINPGTANCSFPYPVQCESQLLSGPLLPQAYDLTEGGVNQAFAFTIVSADHPGSVYFVTAWTSTTSIGTRRIQSVSQRRDPSAANYDGEVLFYDFPLGYTMTLKDGTRVGSARRYVIPFSAFNRFPTAATTANWASIRGLQVQIAADTGLDTTLADFRTVPLVTQVKSANITESVTVDSIANPGEIINYSILISVATGLPADQFVTNTFFYDNPAEYISYGTFIPSSVTLQAYQYLQVNCSVDFNNNTNCFDSYNFDSTSFGAQILTGANNPIFTNKIAVFFPAITSGSYVYINYQVRVNNLECQLATCLTGCTVPNQASPAGAGCYCDLNQGRVCLNVGINQTSTIAGALDAAGNGSSNVTVNGCSPTIDSVSQTFITTTPIGATPNPAIVLTANPAQKTAGVLPCNYANFTFTLTNNRSRSSDAFVVRLTPDSSVTCDAGANTVNPTFTRDATTGFPVYSVPAGLQYGASLTVGISCLVNCDLGCGINQTVLVATIDFGTNTQVCPEDITVDDVSQDFVPIIGAASLTISKQNATAITAGSSNTATFTINYANTGARIATGVVITETIPAALASFYQSTDNPAWTSVGGNAYTYTVPTLAANANGSTSFTYRVPTVLDDCVTGTFQNNVSVNGVCGGQPVTAVAYVNVNAVPDLAVTIPNVTAPSTITSGSSVCYNVQYQNVGYRVGQTVTINVNLPAYTTFASSGSAAYTQVGTSNVYTLAVGTVAGQSGVTVVPFCVTVNANTPCASSFSFSANITTVCPGYPETNLANNFATSSPLTIAGNVNLVLSKVAYVNGAQVTSLTPGATVVYNISGSNTGTSQATGVTITETLPVGTTAGANSLFTAGSAGTYTYSVGTVNAGATFGPVSFTVVIPSSVACPAPSVTNVASVTETCTSATASANVTLPITASPVLTLNANNVSTVILAQNNQTCVYACYANTGNQVANAAVMTLTSGAYATFINGSSWTQSGTTYTYTVGDIAVGASACSPSACFAVTTPIPCGVNSIPFNFSLSSVCYAASPVVARTSVSIVANPVFTITKTNSVPVNTEASPGSAVTYTIQYQNIGFRIAENTVITESVPTLFTPGTNAGFTCSGSSCTYAVGTLSPVDGLRTITFAGSLSNNVPGSLSINNTVTIASQPCNASASASSVLQVAGYPNLIVTKTDNGVTATPGEYIVYTIQYSNNGDADAPNSVITETIPAYTIFNRSLSSSGFNCADGVGAGTVCNYSLNTVARGASGTLTLVVKLADWVRCGINFTTNFVSISTTATETTYVDNADTEDTPIDGTPNLVITKTTNRTSGRSGRAGPGDLITYTINFSNTGLRDAVGTIITETIPQYTTFDQAGSTGQWSCADGSPAGTVCTINLGTIYPMMPGMDNSMASGSYNFSVRVISALPPDAHLTTNCVYINNTCDDCNMFDNMACAPVILYGTPDLVLNQSAICRSIHWYLEWSNVGDQSASNAVITDSVPASTMFNAAASDSRWSCNVDTTSVNYGQCTLNVGTIASGAGGSAVFVTNPMNGSTATMYTNTASITGSGVDPTPENNQDTATVGFEGCPDACDSCCPIANTCCPDKTEVLFTFAGILDGLSQCSSTS